MRTLEEIRDTVIAGEQVSRTVLKESSVGFILLRALEIASLDAISCGKTPAETLEGWIQEAQEE